MDIVGAFISKLEEMTSPRVVELGTKRSDPDICTSWKQLLSDRVPGLSHVGTDFEQGIDVDVVADIHHLMDAFEPGSFDGFLSNSTFEHVRWPWVAAMELNRILRPGGVGFVSTHQTFPIHSYPNDYWRFTTEGLSSLFCPELGWKTLSLAYSLPARIIPPSPDVESWDKGAEVFLNVNLVVEKVAEIDDDRFRWPVGYEQGSAAGSR